MLKLRCFEVSKTLKYLDFFEPRTRPENVPKKSQKWHIFRTSGDFEEQNIDFPENENTGFWNTDFVIEISGA